MKRLFHTGQQANAVRPLHAGACHNCHSPVSGKFCGQCGQPSHVHVASAHEFIHHFVGHYVAAEGKLWATLRMLLLRPGQLTLAFIGGRRGRYIDPLRLLLTISLVAFLIMKLVTAMAPARESAQDAQAKAAAPAGEKARKPLVFQAAYFLVDHASKNFAAKYAEHEARPAREQTAYFWNFWLKSGPTIILCLVPIVALILKLLHLGSGWRYGEHLVFSIHLQCFTTIGFLAWVLIDTYSKTIALLPLGCMLLYPAWAMHQVYRSGWLVLLARWAALVFLEFQCFGFLFGVAYLFSMA